MALTLSRRLRLRRILAAPNGSPWLDNPIAELVGFALVGALLIVLWSLAAVSTSQALATSYPSSFAAPTARTSRGLGLPPERIARISAGLERSRQAPRPGEREDERELPPLMGSFIAGSPAAGREAHILLDAGSTPAPAPKITPAQSRAAVPPAARALGGGARRPAPPAELLRLVDEAAARQRPPIPRHILAGLAEDESSWRPHVAGKNGELGLFQLKESTAAWCGISDRLDAAASADCGARYLASHFRTFGTWELALVAFKAGPAAIPESIPATSWAFARRALARAEAYR